MLFGGQSAEHEVSCTTAAHVVAAADRDRYRITPIGITTDGRWALSRDGQQALADPSTTSTRLSPAGESVSPEEIIGRAGETDEITVVFPLLHGPMGEDGTVQGLLELADVPYVGSGVLGSAVAMDKAIAKQLCAQAGIAQARYRAIHADEITDELPTQLADELGLPCFIKPANMGSSVGVSKAHTTDEIADGLRIASTYDEWVVIEEGIIGREIELAVMGNRDLFVSQPGEIILGDEFYSYDDKYVNMVSKGVIPADLTPDQADEVRSLALDAYRALRVEGLARCDFFFEDPTTGGRGFLLNEINTMPGFTPISMFPKLVMSHGWTYGEIIDQLIELALERHRRRRRKTDR